MSLRDTIFRVNFLINGYFGFANAGDEAVLSAMIGALKSQRAGATFCATSGDPNQTRAMHGCEAVGRQSPRDLMEAIKRCDVFLSGGGSLLQDVTSVRNVVYYTGVLRMARLSGKPAMMYAQGVGPLRSPIARKLARSAFQSAEIATVRDGDSAQLLREIGVTRAVEITADPVWGLAPATPPQLVPKRWVVALRSWPGAPDDSINQIVAALREAARAQAATLRFLPMQPGPDDEILNGLVEADEKLDVEGKTPAQIVALAASGELMIAMRLHALIFAAGQGAATVALNYDPKVSSLAKLLAAPILSSPAQADTLPQLIAAARPSADEKLMRWRELAMRNAELAAGLAR